MLSLAQFGAGSANAQNLLLNPGAEEDNGGTCSTASWTVSDSNVVQGVETQAQTQPNAEERSGECFFTMAGAAAVSADMNQDVDVAGCSLFGLATWTASGWIQTEEVTDDSDEGGLNIRFFDAGDSQVGATSSQGNLTFEQPGGSTYQEFSDSGNIPEDAVTANYEVTGTLVSGTFINVFYDDLSFEVDCVTDAAKISGGKERGQGKGGGNSPLYAFSGAVGNLEGTENVGTIEINYRDPAFGPTTCTFTPTDISYLVSPDGAVIEADYECAGGDKDGDTGSATIELTDKEQFLGCGGGNFRGRNKDRGSVAVDADDDDLDISGSDGIGENENCLETGNVEIVPPQV